MGAPFALGENFGEQQTPSLVLSPKFSPNTKLPPQILELDSNKSDSVDLSLRGRIADSHEAIQKNKIDCHDSAFAESRNDNKKTNSANPPQQTIEGIAVEVAEFLPIFECETGLVVCETPKIPKSAELHTQE